MLNPKWEQAIYPQNCFYACLGSLIHIKQEHLPFRGEFQFPKDMDKVNNWLKTINYNIQWNHWTGDFLPAPAYNDYYIGGIMTGQINENYILAHAVVCKEKSVIWDPAPSSPFLGKAVKGLVLIGHVLHEIP
jgi:hypothetical protein